MPLICKVGHISNAKILGYSPCISIPQGGILFPGGTSGKELYANAGDIRDRTPSLGWEDPLEEGMAVHFGVLACRIPRIEKPGGLQSMELQRVTEAT